MSDLGKRVEGIAEELGGKIEKAVGHVIGNAKIEAEGAQVEQHGQAMQKDAQAPANGEPAAESKKPA